MFGHNGMCEHCGAKVEKGVNTCSLCKATFKGDYFRRFVTSSLVFGSLGAGLGALGSIGVLSGLIFGVVMALLIGLVLKGQWHP